MKNAAYGTHDVARCCTNKLGIEFRQGAKELNGWFRFRGQRVARITVPRGRKSLPPKTYRSMAAQLKLTVEQFDALLDCTIRRPEYETILADALR